MFYQASLCCSFSLHVIVLFLPDCIFSSTVHVVDLCSTVSFQTKLLHLIHTSRQKGSHSFYSRVFWSTTSYYSSSVCWLLLCDHHQTIKFLLNTIGCIIVSLFSDQSIFPGFPWHHKWIVYSIKKEQFLSQLDKWWSEGEGSFVIHGRTYYPSSIIICCITFATWGWVLYSKIISWLPSPRKGSLLFHKDI